jgi:hypothetical protein
MVSARRWLAARLAFALLSALVVRAEEVRASLRARTSRGGAPPGGCVPARRVRQPGVR